MKKYNVAVIGYGYWGPNIVRNFYDNTDCRVKFICDNNKISSKRAADTYPNIEIINDPDIIFADNEIDIVSIVTPVSTHYHLAKKALEAGKHVHLCSPYSN